jgi:hypothetical protein
MFHGPLLTLLVAFIPVGSAQTVDSYTELQRHIQLIGPLLLEESADTQWEIKDAQLESGVDFFPDDGSVSSSRRLEDIQGSDKFVVFRLVVALILLVIFFADLRYFIFIYIRNFIYHFLMHRQRVF